MKSCTYVKHFLSIIIKNEISCQAVCNKISLDHIPGELKDLKKLIMHGKGEFSKFKGSICNILIQAANILRKTTAFNGLNVT